MEDDYEYDTPSDSDEEPCGHENVWNEVCKRINISMGKIYLQILENDDPSVLTFLNDIIKEGVSGEFLNYQLQIEQQHNAIVWNPSTGNRIKDMRRLEKLCAESTEPLLSESCVHGLEIPNADGFRLPIWTNVKFVTVGNPDKETMEQLRILQNLEYLTIEGTMPVFSMFKGFDSLELLTLRNIKSAYQITNLVCGSCTSRFINLHVVNTQIPGFLAVLFKNNHVQCTNVTVNCERGSNDYQEWRRETKDKLTVHNI